MMDLNGLNPTQKQAVVETEGPVMILAGAGSGKTRTLVSRIAYLLEEKGVSPFRLLALTFSNKAAREMRERVATMVHQDVGTLQMTTFHSFCARLLRTEFKYLGLSRSFSIYDNSESKAIAKTILSRRGISTKETSPYELLYFIENLKNQGYYQGCLNEHEMDVDKDDPFFDMYLEYENELQKANAVDFGGLITAVIRLFETHPKVLDNYRTRFEYILVDEYQDTNRAQFKLLTLLTDESRNICVVGDEDQSIYSWRGADIRNIMDFEEVFPDARLLKLEQNYRSSKRIIEAASAVIARNFVRKGKEMWTDNPEGESIRIVECENDKKEAEYVAVNTQKLLANGVPASDIAVFYRTNSQSRLIEDYLRRSKINYRVVGGVKFYERKEIKDLLAYIRIVCNEKDSLAVTRVINVPARGIGATSLKKIEQAAIESNQSIWEVLADFVDNSEKYSHIRMSARVKKSVSNFVSLIQEAKVQSDSGVAPSQIYEYLLNESGYWEFLKASKDYESQARMENLQELESAIKQYEEVEEKPGFEGFLELITLDQNMSEGDEKQPEVSLMTIHGSKGLEFPHVFIVGAEENVFPSYKSLETGDSALEEERRLFYVAMTRAMEKLTILFAQGRMLFGQLRFNGPSRFLNEIPPSHYEWIREGGVKNSGKEEYFSDPSSDDFSQENEFQDDEPVYYVSESARFPRGTEVVHSLYGVGKIVESQGSGAEEKATIRFADGSKKKFLVKFAPLTAV